MSPAKLSKISMSRKMEIFHQLLLLRGMREYKYIYLKYVKEEVER